MDDLIFALLDTSAVFPGEGAAARARELTIAWTRFKYSGEILEHSDPDVLLQQALATGASYCVLQPYGYLLAEVWRPEDGDVAEVMAAIREAFASDEFLVAGSHPGDGDVDWRNDPGLLLIDLQRLRKLPTQGFDLLEPTRAGDDFHSLPASVARNVVPLDPTQSTLPCDITDEPVCSDKLFENGRDFLHGIDTLTANLRRAVFVWNIEPYADIEVPPPQFQLPVRTLYTVSAGFKPNRMLQTHSFTADTRMVVFDYSPRGLEFRRLLQEDWDGADYPTFLRKLFRKLPPADTHYLLWDGMTPDNLDWGLVETRWQQELASWGGEEKLYQHWQLFRQLKIEYVHCDLLEQPEALLERIEDEPGAMIWWSNAFFSIYSIWHYSAEQRRQIFRRWIDSLSRKNPDLWLHGSDCNNASVNGCSAGEYAAWLQVNTSDPLDELRPKGLSIRQIRY